MMEINKIYNADAITAMKNSVGMQMIRHTRKQKALFRNSVFDAFSNAFVDSHRVAKNVIIGDMIHADTVVCAHYDTPPRLPVWFVRHLLFYALIGIPFVAMSWFQTMFRLPLWTMSPVIMNNLDIYFTMVLAIGYGVMAVYVAHLFGLTPFSNRINMNDNTSGVATILDMAERKREDSRYAFVLFDNEEKGLLGSIEFRRRYNDILKNKRIIVLDCIGLGNELSLYTWGRRTRVVDELLERDNMVSLNMRHRQSTVLSMSDHVAFYGLNATLMLANYRDRGVRWARWRRRNSLATIHTKRDNYLKPSNLYQVMTLIESL
jgi:hypothetical protein